MKNDVGELVEDGGKSAIVGLIMGSLSDWSTMVHCAGMLDELGIAFERKIVSAHRTPDLMGEYAREAAGRGIRVIIAAAGGSAHLPGMTAAQTLLPVIGVPIQAWAFDGLDSLLSIVNMPGGIPVATMSVGKPGAINAALYACAMLAVGDAELRKRLETFRANQRAKVLGMEFPR